MSHVPKGAERCTAHSRSHAPITCRNTSVAEFEATKCDRKTDAFHGMWLATRNDTSRNLLENINLDRGTVFSRVLRLQRAPFVQLARMTGVQSKYCTAHPCRRSINVQKLLRGGRLVWLVRAFAKCRQPVSNTAPSGPADRNGLAVVAFENQQATVA